MKPALAFALACAACGRIASEDDASTPDASDAAIIDALTDVLATCPYTSPVGEPCSRAGLACEYGPYFKPYCNDEAVCMDGSFVDLPPPPNCAATYEFDAGCPPEPVEGGTACPSEYAACDYPGRHCICTSTCVIVKSTWLCFDSPPNCPIERPRIGTSCPSDGQLCSYGETCCGGVEAFCTGGVWQRAPGHTCP